MYGKDLAISQKYVHIPNVYINTICIGKSQQSMNRSHIMNVLSYENYCLKVKLQELLEKMTNLHGGKFEQQAIESPPPRPSDTSSEEEYKEIINKKDIEIEQLKDIIATLTAELNTKEETTEQRNSPSPSPTPIDNEKIAQYEAAIAALQEQHKLLHETAAQHQSTIESYQEQHKQLQETAEQYQTEMEALREEHKQLQEAAAQNQSTISSYQEQHQLLHDTAAQYQSEMESLREQHKQLHENAAQNQLEMEAIKNALQEEREQFRTIIIGKDAEISHYKR
jgi:hypothetical protein